MSLENPNLNNEGHEDVPSINAENTTEEIFDSVEDMTEKLEEATFETVKTIESSSLPPEQKEKFRKRLEQSMKKILRIFSFATALTGTAGMVTGVVTHQSSRYKVESKIISADKIEYVHEDKETTHILNILSGKEGLNGSDKRDILIDYLADRIEFEQFEGRSIKPGELNEKSLDELYQLVDKFVRIDNPSGKFISLEEKLKRILIDPTLSTFDPELYVAIWELERECGNPKVRFRLAEKKNLLGLGDIVGRSFYRPDTNTVYIDMSNNDESIGNYIAELSHAKQFNENPTRSIFRGANDLLNVAKATLVGDDNEELEHQQNLAIKADIVQGALYDKPGTVEHEAHGIIEPELWKKFKNLTPARSKKEKHNNEIEEQIKIEFKKLEEEKRENINKLYTAYFKDKYKVKEEDRAAFDVSYSREENKIKESFASKKESMALKLRNARQ